MSCVGSLFQLDLSQGSCALGSHKSRSVDGSVGGERHRCGGNDGHLDHQGEGDTAQ